VIGGKNESGPLNTTEKIVLQPIDQVQLVQQPTLHDEQAESELPNYQAEDDIEVPEDKLEDNTGEPEHMTDDHTEKPDDQSEVVTKTLEDQPKDDTEGQLVEDDSEEPERWCGQAAGVRKGAA